MRRPDTTPGLWLPACWPAPAAIRAGTTTRAGGVSIASFASFNLALHVGDDPAHVEVNRRQLRRLLELPAEPCWLEQHHGANVIDPSRDDRRNADACYSAARNVVCAVLSADCIPVLLASRDGSEIAAVHAGWRGLCTGVIQAAVGKFRAPASALLAWLGPHIQKESYEVRSDMRDACRSAIRNSEPAFRAAGDGCWTADLATLARLVLHDCGVGEIHENGSCTFRDPDRFYSHRRESNTGRMATLIWRTE